MLHNNSRISWNLYRKCYVLLPFLLCQLFAIEVVFANDKEDFGPQTLSTLKCPVNVATTTANGFTSYTFNPQTLTSVPSNMKIHEFIEICTGITKDDQLAVLLPTEHTTNGPAKYVIDAPILDEIVKAYPKLSGKKMMRITAQFFPK